MPAKVIFLGKFVFDVQQKIRKKLMCYITLLGCSAQDWTSPQRHSVSVRFIYSKIIIKLPHSSQVPLPVRHKVCRVHLVGWCCDI